MSVTKSKAEFIRQVEVDVWDIHMTKIIWGDEIHIFGDWIRENIGEVAKDMVAFPRNHFVFRNEQDAILFYLNFK